MHVGAPALLRGAHALSLRRRAVSTIAVPRAWVHSGARRSAERDAQIAAANRNLAQWAIAVVVGAVGLTYASVPLYRVFCQVTGFGGTTRSDEAFATPLVDAEVVPDRPVRVRFTADSAAAVPWRFAPVQKELTVLPGETALAFYVARNDADYAVTGIATYNVAPPKAGPYFNKVQCFCFDEQRLQPNEEIHMPVFFFLDPEFAYDPAMHDVHDITLSYTFFRAQDVTPEELQRAQAMLH